MPKQSTSPNVLPPRLRRARTRPFWFPKPWSCHRTAIDSTARSPARGPTEVSAFQSSVELEFRTSRTVDVTAFSSAALRGTASAMASAAASCWSFPESQRCWNFAWTSSFSCSALTLATSAGAAPGEDTQARPCSESWSAFALASASAPSSPRCSRHWASPLVRPTCSAAWTGPAAVLLLALNSSSSRALRRSSAPRRCSAAA
mmetsp:Transcript_103701/g.260066  ORF Transcript_103701/g.260066 Transcript_103701/m.260066 type:complete len:203 (+) Transcript_103701:594-1202(+)